MTDTDKKIEEACVEMLYELGLDEPPYCADILKLMRFAKEQRAEAMEEAAAIFDEMMAGFGGNKDSAKPITLRAAAGVCRARAREIKEDEG